jgi:hypothetical protein
LFKLRIVHLSRPPRRFGDQQHRDPVTHGCQINGGAAWYVLESSTHEVEWRSGIQSAALAVVILSAHAAAHGGPARRPSEGSPRPKAPRSGGLRHATRTRIPSGAR